MSFHLRALVLLLLPQLLLPAQTAPTKRELYLLMPEPHALRSSHSRVLEGAKRTVLTPAYEIGDASGVHLYDKDEFARLGISVETFTERAVAAAEARLAKIMPEFIKDETGKTRYAVYRGESPLIATLLVAPSLAKLVSKVFGGEVWAVTPDRHSLYLFPAKPELLAEFADDLRHRFESDPLATSCEVFVVEAGKAPRAIGTYGEN